MVNKINKVEFICLYNKNKKYKDCLLNFNWDEFYTNADMNLAFKKSKEKSEHNVHFYLQNETSASASSSII